MTVSLDTTVAGGSGGDIWTDQTGTALRRPDGTSTSLASAPKQALLTVVCGNSIAAQSKSTNGDVQTNSEIHHANYLSGSPMRFMLMNAATTRSDVYGTYGYSGQTLTTILADLSTQWHDQIAGSGVTPELVIGHSLLENSIVAGHSVATMTADLTAWIRLVRVWWPGCLILLMTPRPSHTYNTAPLVAAYQGIVAYMLTLDNGVDTFVTQMNAYESGSSPGTPLVGAVTGTRSGTALTVTTTTHVLGIGDKLLTGNDATNYATITAYGTGTGGAGTYTLTVTGSLSTTDWTLSQYTDQSVHPSARGAMANARSIKRTFDRLGSVWVQPHVGAIGMTSIGAMTGSGAASGTNVSGTVPTSTAVSGSANGTFVSSALNPGWEITINNNAQGYRTDLSTFYQGVLPYIAGGARISPFAVFEIVSGAANLGALGVSPRQYYGTNGGSNGFAGGMVMQTGEQDGEWLDGDTLTMVSLPMLAPSGAFTQVSNYFRPYMAFRAGTGSVTLRVLASGVYIPDGVLSVQRAAPAAAGTVTVDATLGDVVHITMAGATTIAAPINPRFGQRLDFVIQKDAGGSAVTWNAAFKKAADGAGGASTVGSTSFVYNGANWVQVGGALAFV